jgi:hypothetical protein
MVESNSIGLSELIEKVREELLNEEVTLKKVPLLYVDSVELELKISFKTEANGGIKIYVANIGGGETTENSQTIKVKMSSLLDKETLMNYCKTHYPNMFDDILDQSQFGLMKGSSSDLDDGIA